MEPQVIITFKYLLHLNTFSGSQVFLRSIREASKPFVIYSKWIILQQSLLELELWLQKAVVAALWARRQSTEKLRDLPGVGYTVSHDDREIRLSYKYHNSQGSFWQTSPLY